MLRISQFLSLLHLFDVILLTSCLVVSPVSKYQTFKSNNRPDSPTSSRREAIIQLVQKSALAMPIIITGTSSNPLEAQAQTQQQQSAIEDRISAEQNLTLPPPSRPTGELYGIDNLYYPSWLEGEWDATQTLVNTATPLGLRFVGGPNGSESIAKESVTEQRKQLNISVPLRLRYVKTKFGVAEDRLFNTKQRLDGFAGRGVVASVEYADVGASNRASVIAMGGDEGTPLQTTVTRFKGPAAQKSFLIGHGEDVKADKCGDKFASYEVLRSIFALTNTNTAPPVTTDTELIWLFEKIDDRHVNAKLRMASYLNAQSDKLYFEAKNQAVSFADYELKLTKKV